MAAQPHPSNVKAKFVVIVVLILLVGWFASTWAASTVSSSHGFDKHAEIALKIMDCFRNNGKPYNNLIFKGKDKRYYLPCQLPDGKIGIGIFDEEGNNITSYIPGDGTWNSVREYILQRATRITGGLPFSF